MVGEETGMPAKRELSMRQIANTAATSPRRGERARDRATLGRGALDNPGQPETLADAILDRVVHNAYRIELAGESLRKRRPSS
jgi:hypothetical protein